MSSDASSPRGQHPSPAPRQHAPPSYLSTTPFPPSDAFLIKQVRLTGPVRHICYLNRGSRLIHHHNSSFLPLRDSFAYRSARGLSAHAR